MSSHPARTDVQEVQILLEVIEDVANDFHVGVTMVQPKVSRVQLPIESLRV